MKVFQAGLIAPATISAMLYSSNSDPEAADDAAAEPPAVAQANIAAVGMPFFATPVSGMSLAFGGSDEWAADKKTKCLINGFLGKKC